MRKLLLFICGMFVGGGFVCFAYNYHVVYSNKGLSVIPRDQAGLGDLYVDVRSWKPVDWQSHPQLVRSLVTHGRGELIGLPNADSLRDLLRKFSNAEKPDDELQLK